MPRPLMQHGVEQLEEMFAKGGADPEVLKQLENELRYRQVPRAVALLAEVQAAMYGATPASPPRPAPEPPPARPPAPQQPSLWERPTVQPTVVATPPALPPRPATPSRPAEAPAPAMPSQPSAPTMPVEDAYKLLKATAGSTWESIEQTRRQLVQQSHPGRLKSMSPERRTQALAEAKKLNAAYGALSYARCSSGKPSVSSS
jgi:DnaJ-domain-containing protein 1